MQPIEFPGSNVVFGKDQPEYRQLPALALQDKNGIVITCWEFTDEEVEEIIKTKKMYIQQMTFNKGIQPLLPIVDIADAYYLTDI